MHALALTALCLGALLGRAPPALHYTRRTGPPVACSGADPSAPPRPAPSAAPLVGGSTAAPRSRKPTAGAIGKVVPSNAPSGGRQKSPATSAASQQRSAEQQQQQRQAPAASSGGGGGDGRRGRGRPRRSGRGGGRGGSSGRGRSRSSYANSMAAAAVAGSSASTAVADDPATASAAKAARAAKPRQSRGKGGGRQDATRALTDYLGTFEEKGTKKRLLEHGEEIMLAKRVQRLKELEVLYSELAGNRSAAVVAEMQLQHGRDGGGDVLEESVIDAIYAEGGASRGEWADAANVSVSELRVELRDGRLARERIVTSNIGLVGSLVQQLKRSSGGRIDSGTTEQDLIQEGCISLLRAAERFDVSLGIRFSTYATFWVKAAIRHALREQSRTIRLPARVHNNYGRIQRATNAIAEKSSGSRDGINEDMVSAELLASGVELKPQKIRQVLEFVKTRPSSLDARLKDGDDGATVLDLVVDDSTRIEAEVVQNMLQADLSKLMSKHLRHDETKVLDLRFGLSDGKARTVRQVGEEMGVPYATTKHMLFTALSKMRKPHVAVALRDYLSSADPDAEEL